MFRALYQRVGFSALSQRPALWPKTFLMFFTQSPRFANEIYEKVVSSHREVFKRKNITQIDKITDFLCAMHLRNESELKSERYRDLDWICKEDKGGVRVTRAWIDAIQQEIGLELIPKDLLRISSEKNAIRVLYETIHYIHKATYNVLRYKEIPVSLTMIFRNALCVNEKVTLKGEISEFPVVEFDQIEVTGILNTRCCSIKPHGCENYDFDLRQRTKFVIARGMDEKEYMNYECVMPTILYTLHEKDFNRFKGNASHQEIITVAGEQLWDFFFLYEQASI